MANDADIKSLKRSSSDLDFDGMDEASSKKHHSGMFRNETVQLVTEAADRLKTLQHNADPAAIIEILDELSDYVIDEKVLERTKIGLDVSALQKHSDAELAGKAKALVTVWKRDRDTRNKVVKGFIEKANLSLKDARRLEEGVFNAACPLGFLEGEGKKNYQRHFIRISTHLKDQGSRGLLQRLREGELELEEVAFQSDESLFSDAKREKVMAHKEAGLKEALATGSQVEGTASSEYVCPRCSSSRCVYKDLQTGWHNDQQDVTILVQCLDCSERWKANDDHGVGGS